MKIVESNYYPDGFSDVILEHQGKQYEGKSFYNKEEEYPPSPFFGQRLAEKRAIIEIWKEKRDINKIKRQALKSLRKDIEKTLLNKNIPYGERGTGQHWHVKPPEQEVRSARYLRRIERYA